MADKKYKEIPATKFDIFHSYVFSTDMNAVGKIKSSVEKTKTLRARRKGKLCPTCSTPMNHTGRNANCPNCGYVVDAKLNTVCIRVSPTESKHILKQLELASGVRKASESIKNIIDPLIIWLTDLRYIYNWLISKNDTIGYYVWIEKYKVATDEKITDPYKFFCRIIPRDPNHRWDYPVFKLLTDEFYDMIGIAHRYNTERSSNMEILDDEDIEDIFRDYIKDDPSRLGKIPPITEVYNECEIGYYMTKLSLIFDVDDNHIKRKVERILGLKKNQSTLPGLCFNYSAAYSKCANVPEKFNYQQEYAFIIHTVFHVEYIKLTERDKDAILDLAMKFNGYYKQEMTKVTGNTANSPLYCCTLLSIYKLKYFEKYIDAIGFLPIKDKTTTNHILAKWHTFTTKHPELVEQFERVNDGSNDGSVLAFRVNDSNMYACDSEFSSCVECEDEMLDEMLDDAQDDDINYQSLEPPFDDIRQASEEE